MKLHALALAAGMMMTGGANAITAVSYDLPSTATQALGLFGASTEWVAGVSVPQGTIDHTLTFTITEDLYAGSGISDTELSFTIGSMTIEIYNIIDLSADIFKSDNTPHVSFEGNGDANHLSLPDNAFFAQGNYTLKIGGLATGNSGGLYTITAVTVPVPEPETWAMLLVGMGLVGLRVQQKAKASREAALA